MSWELRGQTKRQRSPPASFNTYSCRFAATHLMLLQVSLCPPTLQPDQLGILPSLFSPRQGAECQSDMLGCVHRTRPTCSSCPSLGSLPWELEIQSQTFLPTGATGTTGTASQATPRCQPSTEEGVPKLGQEAGGRGWAQRLPQRAQK